MPSDPSQDAACPATCPNRKSDARAGKYAAYLFALIASGFLAFNCLSYDRRDQEVPVLVWMPCLLLIGTGLGVNIDPAILGGLLKR